MHTTDRESLSTTLNLSYKQKEVKVKLHPCKICNKTFPRPSALRTHMNSHDNAKPFPCEFPGCTMSFSVLSNARRHLRIHNVARTAVSVEQSPIPYIVEFSQPITTPTAFSCPTRLRWKPCHIFAK